MNPLEASAFELGRRFAASRARTTSHGLAEGRWLHFGYIGRQLRLPAFECGQAGASRSKAISSMRRVAAVEF
jgi:hypothetical protein